MLELFILFYPVRRAFAVLIITLLMRALLVLTFLGPTTLTSPWTLGTTFGWAFPNEQTPTKA